MKKRSNKTKAIIAASTGAAVLVCTGAFALFSDVSLMKTGATVGTVQVEVLNSDISNKLTINPGDNSLYWSAFYDKSDTHYIPTKGDPLYEEGMENLDPTKKESYIPVTTTPHDLTFTVANTGTKSVRTRHIITISAYQTEDGEIVEQLNPEVFKVSQDGLQYGMRNYKYDSYWVFDRWSGYYWDGGEYEESDAEPYGVQSAATPYFYREPSIITNQNEEEEKEKSRTDKIAQNWEELCYKFLVDDTGKEYLIEIPGMKNDYGNYCVLPCDVYNPANKEWGTNEYDPETGEHIGGEAIDANIVQVKYVLYSDVFDGVTNDMSVTDAEIENENNSGLSNLGDGDNKNIVPESYHVPAKVVDKTKPNSKIIGEAKTYYKDSNSNTMYALSDENHTYLFYYNEHLNCLYAAEDLSFYNGQYNFKAGDKIELHSHSMGTGFKFSEFKANENGLIEDSYGVFTQEGFENTTLFPVEFNTEFDEKGEIVWSNDIDANGREIEGTLKPVVHAYNSKDYTYMLGMYPYTGNEYQGATVQVDVVVEGLQYRNTKGNDDWKILFDERYYIHTGYVG